jgi:hypothetical protein
MEAFTIFNAKHMGVEQVEMVWYVNVQAVFWNNYCFKQIRMGFSTKPNQKVIWQQLCNNKNT